MDFSTRFPFETNSNENWMKLDLFGERKYCSEVKALCTAELNVLYSAVQ